MELTERAQGSIFAVIGEYGLLSVALRNAARDEAGLHVRILTRSPETCSRLGDAKSRRFELDDATTFPSALDGVDVLVLATPPHPRQVERALAVLDAARTAGVRHILNVSMLGADLPAPISTFARWQGEIEQALAASPLSWTTLRPASSTSNLLRQKLAICGGTYVEPLGDARMVSIDGQTVADCAMAIARNAKNHDRQAFDVTGSAAYTGPEIAEILGRIVERSVSFVSPAISNYRNSPTKRGMPTWHITALCELYEALQAGRAAHLSCPTDAVERLTGKPPRSFESAAAWELLV